MLEQDFLMAIDPVAFSQSVGIVPDPWQAEVLRSDSRRLLLNCCRQAGKSTTTAIKALHTAIYHPHSLILLGSPSLRQSSELFRKVRESYNKVENPPKLTEDNKLSLTMTNGSRIVSLPGDPATVRGYSGVALFLEDEASQVSDDFYGAILPMLMIGDGQLILMSTPFGKRGHFYDEWTNGGNDWVRHAVTAKECPRMTVEQLEQQRRSMGDLFFRQEFECEFVDTVEQTFSYDSIHRAFSEEVEPLAF